MADYTQAIMDLGATLCTRARPACTVCPLATDCAACRAGTQAKYPAPRPKRARAHRRVTVLVVEDPDGRILLERRPARGVWGGLYSLPELGETETAAEWCGRELGAAVQAEHELATIEHAFTHFDLDLLPRLLRLATAPTVVNDRDDRFWHVPSTELEVGIPAPVAALFRSLTSGSARAAARAAARETRHNRTGLGSMMARRNRGASTWREWSIAWCSARKPRGSTACRIPASSANGSTRTCRSSRGSAGSSTRRC